MDIKQKIEELKENHKQYTLKIQGAIEVLESLLKDNDNESKEKKK